MVGESVVGIRMWQEENVWEKVLKAVVVSLAGRSFDVYEKEKSAE